jgi:hypothetical protein
MISREYQRKEFLTFSTPIRMGECKNENRSNGHLMLPFVISSDEMQCFKMPHRWRKALRCKGANCERHCPERNRRAVQRAPCVHSARSEISEYFECRIRCTVVPELLVQLDYRIAKIAYTRSMFDTRSNQIMIPLKVHGVDLQRQCIVYLFVVVAD